jgi:hypothetical protein
MDEFILNCHNWATKPRYNLYWLCVIVMINLLFRDFVAIPTYKMLGIGHYADNNNHTVSDTSGDEYNAK